MTWEKERTQVKKTATKHKTLHNQFLREIQDVSSMKQEDANKRKREQQQSKLVEILFIVNVKSNKFNKLKDEFEEIQIE